MRKREAWGLSGAVRDPGALSRGATGEAGAGGFSPQGHLALVSRGEPCKAPEHGRACRWRLIRLPSSLPRTRPAADLGAWGSPKWWDRGPQGRGFLSGSHGVEDPSQPPALIRAPSGNPGPGAAPSSGRPEPEGMIPWGTARGPLSSYRGPCALPWAQAPSPPPTGGTAPPSPRPPDPASSLEW